MGQFRMAFAPSSETMRAAYHRCDHAQKSQLEVHPINLSRAFVAPEAAWTHQGRVGEKGGPFPQTGVDVVAG